METLFVVLCLESFDSVDQNQNLWSAVTRVPSEGAPLKHGAFTDPVCCLVLNGPFKVRTRSFGKAGSEPENKYFMSPGPLESGLLTSFFKFPKPKRISAGRVPRGEPGVPSRA